MLLLGIPYHACEAYRLSGGFIIESPDTSFAATLFTALVHSFRMPGFFLLSGYFGAMILTRRGAGIWLRERIIKLGIPLVATMATLGIAEQALIIHFRSGLPLQAAFIPAMEGPIRDWINHRWFLVVLILFCITLAALHRFLPWAGSADQWFSQTRRRRILLRAAALAVLALIPFAAIVAGKVAGEWFFTAPAFKQYAIYYGQYVIFFLFGAVLMATRNGLLRFSAVSKGDIVIFLISLFLYTISYFAFYQKDTYDRLHMDILHMLISSIAGLYTTKMFFALMRKLFASQNPYVLYFVDASFCIYLVHEIFLLPAVGRFLSSDWPPAVEIALTCAFTIAASVITYEIARRSSTLARILNGGAFRRPLAPAPASA
jgi:glucan biosynthesis protein C